MSLLARIDAVSCLLRRLARRPWDTDASVGAGRQRLSRREARAFADAMRAHTALMAEAEALLGRRAVALLQRYGKLMGGPRAGQYVGGLPASEQLQLVRRLAGGETVPVHLMHRHRSGRYESSSLRFFDGFLIQVFADREQAA